LNFYDKLKQNRVLLLSVFVITITAFLSTGFAHPDEHYQILELLNLKTNHWTMPSILNWDYTEKIRPWFQTYVYYLIKNILFVDNPFVLSFFIRLFNGLLGIFSAWLILDNFEKNKRDALVLFSLIWFVPFLLVRTNSESLSTSLFFIGAYLYQKKSRFFSGLIWGASFLTRYQMGVVVFCVNIWELYKKRNYKEFVIHSLAISLAIVIGIGIDYWGYDVINLSFWNYFRENILHSRASGFGTSPFYYYFFAPIFKGGILIPLAICYGIFKYHKENRVNFWTVSFWSFFIIHSLIPHKEVRFITFNFLLGTLMALPYLRELWIGKYRKYIKILIVINFLIMVRTSLFPANSYMTLYQYMYENEINRIGVLTDKVERHFGFSMPFYQRAKIETYGVLNLENKSGFYLSTKYYEFEKIIESSKCAPEFKSYPSWIKMFNIGNWLKRSSYFVIWNCN